MIKNSEQRIEKLYLELDSLRAEQERLNKKALEWAEKRDDLHKEIKKMRSEAKKLKERRDILNAEVRELKTLREEAKRTHREKTDQLRGLRQEIRKVTINRPHRSFQSIKDEIERIEWKIQTESSTLDEERRLVERAKTLESQLEVYHGMKSLRDEKTRLENELKKFKDQNVNICANVSEMAKESQEFHAKMVGKLEKARVLKAEADGMHRKYVENKVSARVLHLKYMEILGRVKVFQRDIRKKEEEEKAKKQAHLRKKFLAEALAKLTRGEKLTFEEFKILAEKGKA